MDSLNIDSRSKTLVFKKIKHLLYKHYPIFVKTFKKHPNKFDIRHFLVLLVDCVPNMNNYYNIDRLLKTFNVLQVGIAKNPTIHLYSDTKISASFFNKNRT